MRFAILFALALTVAPFCQQEASAGIFRNHSYQPRPEFRPMLQRPTTIIPRRADVVNVPAAGGGRMVGYVANFHPVGRAARMLVYPR